MLSALLPPPLKSALSALVKTLLMLCSTKSTTCNPTSDKNNKSTTPYNRNKMKNAPTNSFSDKMKSTMPKMPSMLPTLLPVDAKTL